MSTGTFVYDIIAIEIETIRGGNGGRLVIRLKCQAYLSREVDVSWVHLETFNPKVFDHFCDIERLVKGPIGSLRPQPEPTT